MLGSVRLIVVLCVPQSQAIREQRLWKDTERCLRLPGSKLKSGCFSSSLTFS